MSLYAAHSDYLNFDPLTDKCLVLDLDETLVHTLETIDWIRELGIYKNSEALALRNRVYKLSLDDVVDEMGTGVLSELAGILRPHLHDFITFSFMYFRIVCVWSAGQRKYVHEIVRLVFAHMREPHLIFSFDDCKHTERIEKPLEYMFNVPGIDKYMNAKNTFVLDDKFETFNRVNPHNGVVIPIYSPLFTISGLLTEENALLQFMVWLCTPEVVDCKDVRTLNKNGIFKYDLRVNIEFDYVEALRVMRIVCKSCNKLTETDEIKLKELQSELDKIKNVE
jgi:hypothetical protein